jgi:hypothetical protein
MATALKTCQEPVATGKYHAISNEQLQFLVIQDPDSSPPSPSADANHQKTQPTLRLKIIPPIPPKPIFQSSEMTEFAQLNFGL